MKNLFCILPMLMVSSGSMAADKCYDFNVTKYSRGLNEIHFVFEDSPTKQTISATIVAQKSTALSTSTKFECKKSLKEMNCVQPDGGGEFTFETTKEKATLKLSYVNLIMGSTGTAKIDEKSEITEDFAIFDVASSDTEDPEGELEETEEVSIQGKEVKCSKAP